MKRLNNYIKEAFKLTADTKINAYHYFPETWEDLMNIVGKLINERGEYANLNDIDTSQIEKMNYLFGNSKFDGNISEWDVSNVKYMIGMFNGSRFTGKNGDISKWDVSNVKDMRSMFEDSVFDGDISEWKVNDNVKTSAMFNNCPLENHPEKQPKFNK